jgi:hypothetical protein
MGALPRCHCTAVLEEVILIVNMASVDSSIAVIRRMLHRKQQHTAHVLAAEENQLAAQVAHGKQGTASSKL